MAAIVSIAVLVYSSHVFGVAALRDVKTLNSRRPGDEVEPWSYQAIPAWQYDNKDCKGSAQSPIDFLSGDIVSVPSAESSLGAKFTHMKRDGRNLTNNGHTLAVEGDFGTIVLPDGVYQVQDFHFHFPSEHAVNQVLHDGELQITTQRIGEKGRDSMAVIAIFLQSTDRLSADMEGHKSIRKHTDFFKQLGLDAELPGEGDSKIIQGDVSLSSFQSLLSGNYYHYMGSMSEPPCAETVHWYVFEKPAGIAPSMIANYQDAFRVATNRPVQDLNERKVAQNSLSVPGEEWKVLDDQLLPTSVMKEMQAAGKVDPLAEQKDAPVKTQQLQWKYDIDGWNSQSSDCRGSAQSPINIMTSEVSAADSGVSLLNYMNYSTLENLQIFNNGHALQVDAAFGTLSLPDGLYEAKQFHFHFPSEHAINHVLADGEIHIVHQRVGANGTDALAVIAILLQDQDKLAADFDKEKATLERGFLNRLGFGHKLPSSNEKMIIPGQVSFTESFRHGLSSAFYHYEGSLTTPPCSEKVHWYVLERPSLVDKNIIASYQKAFEAQPDAGAEEVLAKARPVQPLNDRKVVSTAMSVPGEFGDKI